MIINYINFINELNITKTYLTKRSDDKEKVEEEFKNLIESISKDLNIILPVNPWSFEFISIKNKLIAEIRENKTIQNYFEDFGKDKKLIEEFLLKYCSNNIYQKKSFIEKKKLNISHLDFKLIEHNDNIETYQVIFPDDIKNYIINNYSTNKLDYLIYINCETDNFNRLHFPGRIERWYKTNNKTFGKDELPQPYKGKHGKYISDLFDGIPESLRGTTIGYSIYKEFLKYKGYLSSSSQSSSLSQSVWKKLTQDNELFGILINYTNHEGNILLFSKASKVDYKKISNEFISKAKEDFKISSIEIDEELKKIIEK